MDWLTTIVKVLGTTNPLTAALVQLHSETESHEFKKTLNRLSDPISAMHPDITKLSEDLYKHLKEKDSLHLEITPDFSEKFSRPISTLHQNGLIEAQYSLRNAYAHQIILRDSTYIFYMCKLAENNKSMQKLVERVDKCKVHEHLYGAELGVELGLPLEVIRTVFDLYAKAGYGHSSEEIGPPSYQGIS